MAKIKQLKDKSGTEQIFPKTKTQAIYNSDGTLLSETLDNLYGSLATIESSPATTNHSIGEYVLYQGQLYKVTAAITTGDSLVVGTNISAVSAGTEIAELNSKIIVEQRQGTLSSVAANSAASLGFGITKSGYTPVGIIAIRKGGAGSGYLVITSFDITDSTAAAVSVYNMYSSGLSNISVTISVLYIKNS